MNNENNTKSNFTDDQYLSIYPEGIQFNFWNIARNNILLKNLKKIPNGKILDIGCGRGIVTDFLFKNNLDVTGVELSKTKPMKNNTVQIYYDIDAVKLDEKLRNEIKIITLFDVIEHIKNPNEFIDKLKNSFPNVEYFVFSVPARKELWSNFDDYFGHIKRYTINEAISEMNKSGLEIVKLMYFFNSLYILMFFNNLFLKKRQIEVKAPTNIFIKSFHKIIAFLFIIESYILPKRFIGTSLLFVAKNK